MIVTEIDINAHRRSAVADLHPQFISRWSPRAMAGKTLDEAQMHSLLEAARWAPSCFNAQPWRFAYALRDSEHWQGLFDALVEANQLWVARAGALIAVASRRNYEHNDKPAPTHSFDAGAAWMSLALQAQHMGLVAHGMQGFDPQAARLALQLPDAYDLPAIIAVGYPGDIDALPEKLREREQPSGRKSPAEIAFRGNFAGLA